MSIEAKGPSLPTAPPGASPFWTLDRVADALQPHGKTNLPRGPHVFGRVWTDTRSLQPGDLFVALAGERFDAHDYLGEAVKAGASALVVSRADAASGRGVPSFVVHDTRAALGALGRYRRRAWNGPVVGVVGTNGKTSTKELIRAALDSRLEVHATHLNLNNLVGVPQTLLAIPDHADVAVIEMGTNQPGEIAALRAIAEPNIVVVTSIGEEHLEGLGDLQGVMREEMAGCDGVAVAIVPSSQKDVVAEAHRRATRVVAAGLDGGDLPIAKWSLDAEGRGLMSINGVDLSVPLRGVHNLRNATLALAVARELGITTEDAARGIANMPSPPMRSNVERIGGVLLINDAYNSNPGSARAALELLAHAGDTDSRAPKRQRVAVLGSMLELGPATPQLHDDIARTALAANVDLVAGVGEFAAALQRVGAPATQVVTAKDAESIWPALESRLEPNAIILLKGSRGVRLERLVPLITSWAKAAS
ncbi:MAG: UDP-N-acetylmuramoyl-tripeptide--D-alanyl-D-alanine ligase [Gemmatimonadaceae bacterium]